MRTSREHALDISPGHCLLGLEEDQSVVPVTPAESRACAGHTCSLDPHHHLRQEL